MIELMKFDVGGCAAVLGSAVAIGELKPDVSCSSR
jgi:leucyl aminopeptidase